jgi:hypothetical protein
MLKPDFFYIIKGLLFSVILTVLRKVLSFRASCSKIYEVKKIKIKGNVEYIATVYHSEKLQYSSLLYDQEYLNI